MNALRQTIISATFLLGLTTFTANSDFCLSQPGGKAMYWEKIRESDERIKKIEVVWLQTRIDEPIKGLNADKSAAYTEAQRQMQGINIKPNELRKMTVGVVQSSQSRNV